MRARGVEPNLVTWNSLAIGYARQQDISSIIGTVERLEADGWEVDDYTVKALKYIRNRSGLISALEEKERKRAAEDVLLEKGLQEAIDLQETQTLLENTTSETYVE